VNRPDTPPDHVTPYDRFAWSDIVVEQLLASGEHQRELIAYFGEAEYRALVPWARQAAVTPIPIDAPRVFVVPGVMGSQLGLLRPAPLPNDVLWIDPVDISIGNLSLLKLPDGAEIVSLGVVLFTYLRLKLQLKIAGFAPVFHDYDWRLGVDDLGRALAERIRGEQGRVMIVAHSMGALVSRAALAYEGMGNVERVVLLGAPNLGSYAPVQALRGVYAVVRKIARMAAPDQSAESLAADVFSTFPALYHLLPPPGFDDAVDFFDPDAWPNSGPRPDAKLLESARTLSDRLATPDDRFTNVVGVGQETVTRVSRQKDGFVYTITRQGDGTVPLACAALPGARTYYTKVAHSELARDPAVAQAITDILRSSGETRLLDAKWSRSGSAEARITDAELRRTHLPKVDWVHMDPDARQNFLRNLNEPPELELRVPGKPASSAVKSSSTARAASKRSKTAPRARPAAAKSRTAVKPSKSRSSRAVTPSTRSKTSSRARSAARKSRKSAPSRARAKSSRKAKSPVASRTRVKSRARRRR
jgi:pimeloyl-ACP methyl ester carboxylesterase